MKFCDAFRYLDEEPYRPYRGVYSVARIKSLDVAVRKNGSVYQNTKDGSNYCPTVTELNCNDWSVDQIIL